MFDCIFWNHPFHKGNNFENIVERASFDPLYEGLESYIRDGHSFLKRNGKLLLGSGNFADLDEVRRIMQKYGCEMVLKHYLHRPFRAKLGHLKTFNLYEIQQKP